MVVFLLTLNALLMIALPIFLGIWIARRYRPGWLFFFIGAAGFILSQVGHLPFNQFLLNPFIANNLDQGRTPAQAVAAALLLGLSAGVFEEVTRWLLYRWRKDMRGWDEGLMFGAGWGGIEAIIFGLLAATTAVNVFIYQSGLIESLVPADQLAGSAEAIAAGAAQIEALAGAPPWELLLGAVERVFALTLHLSLSILVLQVFVRRSILWLFTAIGWHTLANLGAAYGVLQGWNLLAIEGWLAVMAIFSFLIIRRFKPRAEDGPA